MSDTSDHGTGGATLRLDKWLWYARFFKSRSLAQRSCAGGRFRINRRPVEKASASVRVGDVLTFPQRDRIRVVQVTALGARRGPPAEAAGLYADLAPAEAGGEDARGAAGPAARAAGAGRPTKAERRATDRLRDRAAEP